MLEDLLGSIRFAARTASFAAWTSGVVYSQRFVGRFDDEVAHYRGKESFTAAWSRGVVPLLGLDLHVGGERPRELGPFLVVANHRSPLDIFIAVHLIGGVILSHDGVKDIPVVGLAAHATDTIFVDRSDARSGARAIRSIRKRLKERRNVIVFPEGTTFAGDEVRPFKRGSFSAARGLPQVSVLPLGIAYQPGAEFVQESFSNHMKRMTRRAKTPIWVEIGVPVSVPSGAGAEELVRDEVQRLVHRAAAARDAC